jgi:hypothetical protein
MSAINIEIKESAHYPINAGKVRCGQKVNLSEQNITRFENLLELVYLRFFNLPENEKTSNVFSQTANMWGSGLGEFIRLKRGRTWILKSIEFHIDTLMGYYGYRISGFMWYSREIGSSIESRVI